MNSGRAYVWARLEYDKSLPGKDFVKTAKKKKKYTRLNEGNKKDF